MQDQQVRGEPVAGTVAHFDEHAGHGIVRSDEGEDLFFHCTQIADGTRTMDEGAAVTFVVVAGQRGRWEAVRVARR